MQAEKDSDEHSSSTSDETRDTTCGEYGVSGEADDLSTPVKDACDSPVQDIVDVSLRTNTKLSSSSRLYMSMVLVVASLLVVFIGVWECFRVRV